MKKIKKAAAIALAVVLAAPLGFKFLHMYESISIGEEDVPLLKSFFDQSISISIQDEETPLIRSFMFSDYTDPIMEVYIEDGEPPL